MSLVPILVSGVLASWIYKDTGNFTHSELVAIWGVALSIFFELRDIKDDLKDRGETSERP